MSKKSKSQTKPDIIISRSPTGRYVCYNDVIGKGAYKIVYRGYDRYEGKEVAWNMVDFETLSEVERNMMVDEVMLLKTLSPQNKYIINFHNAWVEEEQGKLNFITSLALSGTLKQYISRIYNINLRVVKKWGNQILQGINFLHQQHIAHRDLKCNNIFINSNTGDILIGDLGLAKKRDTKLYSSIGTPEYMAPEMYDETNAGYDEKVDIYAFGMCLLEMLTKRTPYRECTGIGHLCKKVMSGCPPEDINLIKDDNARKIIENCINKNPVDRPSAAELISSHFFTTISESDNDDNVLIDGWESTNQQTTLQQQTNTQNTIESIVSNDVEEQSKRKQ